MMNNYPSDAAVTYAADVLSDPDRRYNAIQRDQVRQDLRPLTDAEIRDRARSIRRQQAAYDARQADRQLRELATEITARRRHDGLYEVTIAGETVAYSRQQIETYLDQTIDSRGQDDGHGILRRAVLVAMDRADRA